MSTTTSPTLWSRIPPTSSNPYSTARASLFDAEKTLAEQRQHVASLRRALPPGPVVPPTTLTDVSSSENDAKVTMADLCGDKTLLVYNHMFSANDSEPCGTCNAITDKLSLLGPALNAKPDVALAVLFGAAAEKVRNLAAQREWNGVKLVSSHGSDLRTKLGLESAKGSEGVPALLALRKGGDGEVRVGYVQTTQLFEGDRKINGLLDLVWEAIDICAESEGLLG